MADNPVTSKPSTDGLALPVPVIICISIGAYVVLVVILLLIRQCLMKRGVCGESCACCGKEGEPQCCECWIAFSEACNCCGSPNLGTCLDNICPARRNLDCADIIMCQCCANADCCGSNEPLCDCEKCRGCCDGLPPCQATVCCDGCGWPEFEDNGPCCDCEMHCPCCHFILRPPEPVSSDVETATAIASVSHQSVTPSTVAVLSSR